ncbi:MAG: thiamine-phosphate kinase [Marinobacter sp.]|nr:thiamine-phosphate kinase [Marinobacter sp.]
MGEFELIERVFAPLSCSDTGTGLVLGVGDDCALQAIPPGHWLAFSVDTLVEGVHFPTGYAPEQLGWRALAVAASDLAAMGASPVCFTLALTVPEASVDWFEALARGMQHAATSFGMRLAGGDTTRGPLALSVQVHGLVPVGQGLRRSGARPGDLICVSGPLGNAAAALHWLSTPAPDARAEQLLASYHHPVPRLALGQWLQGRATAAIDISDGLLADLAHICRASGVGASIDSATIPLTPALRASVGDEALTLALYGGDDYELCFTLPPGLQEALAREAPQVCTVIGKVSSGADILLDGQPVMPHGYDHFGAQS